MADLTYPVLDFGVLGLADWQGPQWLTHLDGRGGHPLDGVVLAHGEEDPDLPGPWARVSTAHRRRWFVRPGVVLADDAAAHARLTLPGTTRAVLDRDGDEVDHRAWATVRWTVDGAEVTAHLVPGIPEAEGAWAGFALVDDDRYVVVAARGVDASTLRLADIGDGASHHVDLTRPLVFPGSITASRAAALGQDAEQ